ncbi:hypothetical protein B0T17DRAFT_618768 [Bombardia bombarda]|uniref:tRNA (guanine-N(7)-)-methyltransferase non-catalytic subunit n=1 Tax=Bombardia bombarda TaxID=252184 RepID=A0AA40BYD9_9PEZI|nr:hypothetical protein B0T17DRAFT_618768 [Bombardia bombarda]
MAVPYHVLKVCGEVVFAARGSTIYSFNSSLECISAWKCDVKPKAVTGGWGAEPSPAAEGPPAKRRRVAADQAPAVEEGQAAPESETPEKGNRRKKGSNFVQKSKPSDRPFVQGLYNTSDGCHLVAITGSDKTIWVFEHDGAGHLTQLSQRMMPKRPCSLAITSDNKTILSADKFGDVFALPLIFSEDPSDLKDVTNSPSSAAATPNTNSRSSTPTTTSKKPFQPQANEFTIHTKRNLKALENQKLSLTLKNTGKLADANFEHTLLLGHVSMLTAVLVAARGPRQYIITADRDEHIRVSRGSMSQAHIIEGFCLGHDDFVSTMSIPAGRPEILVSGGGDDDLFVWDWAAGKLLSRTNILERVQKLVPETSRIAVRHLFTCRPQEAADGPTWVFAICERVPALFCYELKEGSLHHVQTIPTPGNPLDIDYLKPVASVSAPRILLAVDPDISGDGTGRGGPSLLVLSWEPASASGGWHLASGGSQGPSGDEEKKGEQEGEDEISNQELQRILYTTETLRKTIMDDE